MDKIDSLTKTDIEVINNAMKKLDNYSTKFQDNLENNFYNTWKKIIALKIDMNNEKKNDWEHEKFGYDTYELSFKVTHINSHLLQKDFSVLKINSSNIHRSPLEINYSSDQKDKLKNFFDDIIKKL